MKREIIILFPILAAAALCVSCSKEDAIPGTGRGVTVLTASVPQPADTKTNIGSQEVGTSATVVWTAGDKLSVLNGASYGTNSEFTLNDGDGGSATGRFSGEEISGDIIAVYPYSQDIEYSEDKVTLSIPLSQAYNDTSFAVGSFPMVARGAVGQSLEFKYLFSVIAFKVNGNDKSVDSVTVAATTPLWGPAEISWSGDTPAITMTGTDSRYYTVKLTCSTAQDISSDRVFYIAVPAGSYKFAVNVYCSDNTVFHESYYTAKTFTVGRIKYNSEAKSFTENGSAYVEGSYIGDGTKIGSIWWAPVNCGYDATNYKYGKLYQWGRKDGCGYDAEWTDLSSQTVSAETVIQSTQQGPISPDDEKASEFYKNGNSPYDWLSDQSNSRWNSATGDNDPNQTTQVTPTKTTYDPCPIGWRVPTYYELEQLNNAKMSTAFDTGDGKIKGYWFGTDAKNSIFLPSAGNRDLSDGNASNRGSCGYYWSSSVDGVRAWFLYFYDGNAYMYNFSRARGYSVRCVQE